MESDLDYSKAKAVEENRPGAEGAGNSGTEVVDESAAALREMLERDGK